MIFFNLKISTKIIAVSAAMVLVTSTVIVMMVLFQKKSLNEEINSELADLMHKQTAEATRSVYNMCSAQYEAVQNKVDSDLNVARDVLNSFGTVTLATSTVKWEAINQFNGQSLRVKLPRMMAGQRWLGQNRDMSRFSVVVDGVKELVGGTCTVFQRINEAGDMLRVSTNVQKTDGNRAIGTYIPAVNPDGTQNKVLREVMAGRVYSGPAFVVNQWYTTAYEPIRDESSGKIIGVLYVGVPMNTENLRQAIMDMVVGQDGYVYVLGGIGKTQGKYIISQNGKRDGEDLWNVRGPDDKLFVQSLIKKALATSKGNSDFERHPWKNAGDKQERMKLDAVTYFEPWNWVIGAGAYEDNYFTLNKTVDDALRQMVSWVLACTAIIVLLALIFNYLFINRQITRPLQMISEGAKRLATGDTVLDGMDKAAIEHLHNRTDELGEIGKAFKELIADQTNKAGVAQRIAAGDLDVQIEVAGDLDQLGNSMAGMVDSIKAVNSEVSTLTQSALDGRLEIRADASAHKGDFSVMVGGINQLMDAIVEPINEASSVLGSAANKDLSGRMTGSYKGRLATLQNDVNRMLDTLNVSLEQVSATVDQVSSASDQISQGNQSLAEGASEQASSLEEVSSSIEEMASMTRQNADNAGQADSLSKSASESAGQGTQAMIRMTEAINEIKQSSDETSRIVKTIDEIAFQTNLLALNAAVEAARAGEAGKGFAVVAAEVRNLAQRSAEAARTTAGLIEKSVEKSENGVDITVEVGKILKEISEGTGKVSDLVDEISEAAREQAAGIDQINDSVADMDKVTQQNASASEQSASGAEELNGQARELQAMVSEFTLSGGGTSREYSESVSQVKAASGRTKPVSGTAGSPGTRLGAMRSNDSGNNRQRKPKVGKPEELIPLDDIDFDDF